MPTPSHKSGPTAATPPCGSFPRPPPVNGSGRAGERQRQYVFAALTGCCTSAAWWQKCRGLSAFFDGLSRPDYCSHTFF